MWIAAVNSGSLAGVEQRTTTSTPERRLNASGVTALAGAAKPDTRTTNSCPASTARRAMSTSTRETVASPVTQPIYRRGAPAVYRLLVVRARHAALGR